MKQIIMLMALLFCFSCGKSPDNNKPEVEQNSSEFATDVKIAGAMKNVMWKGELRGIISLDTIKPKIGLYGIGPESYLTGELLINDGKSFVSRVLTDSTMSIEQTFKTSAPFFVYAHVNDWEERLVPSEIQTINDINDYLTDITTDRKKPFVFKISGTVTEAGIHIQNLPKGTKVSSPQDAHQGQTNYKLTNTAVEIIGFYSTEHQGVFTHHDSYTHMHLITKDMSQMGHLDHVKLGSVKLYLPKK